MAKKKKTSESCLERICESLGMADEVRTQYKDVEDDAEKAGALSKLHASLIPSNPIDYSNTPPQIRAQNAQLLQALSHKRALEYVKPNLGTIVQNAEADRLAFAAAMSIEKHGSNTYQELAELLAQYQVICSIEHAPNKEHAQRGIEMLLPALIVNRIKGTVPEDELGIIAKIVASASRYDPKYQEDVLKEGIAKVKSDLEGYNRRKVEGYLREKFEDKNDNYLSFAAALGKYKPEKEE